MNMFDDKFYYKFLYLANVKNTITLQKQQSGNFEN